MSVEQLQQALLAKRAEAAETNETKTNKGTNAVYPTPPGRYPGTLDAKWGDRPPPPVSNGTAVVEEAKNVRNDMVDRLFDSPATSAPAQQAEMAQLFVNAREGNPHSPLLQRGRMVKQGEATLMDRVARIVGKV